MVYMFDVIREFGTVDNYVAALMFLQSVDTADQGGLAGAGRAADDDTLTFTYLQVNGFERMKLAIPLMYIPDVDHQLFFEVALAMTDGCMRIGISQWR
jgi:hypothetical protein